MTPLCVFHVERFTAERARYVAKRPMKERREKKANRSGRETSQNDVMGMPRQMPRKKHVVFCACTTDRGGRGEERQGSVRREDEKHTSKINKKIKGVKERERKSTFCDDVTKVVVQCESLTYGHP
jgi:hypothetical protein